MSAKDERAERLAQALRDNLKRRKARARGETGSGPAPEPFSADGRDPLSLSPREGHAPGD